MSKHICWLLLFSAALCLTAASARDLAYGSPRLVPVPGDGFISDAVLVGSTLFALDAGTHRLLSVELSTPPTEATWTVLLDSGERSASQALATPLGMAATPSGDTLYIADTGKNRVVRLLRADDGRWALDAAFSPQGPEGGMRTPRDVTVSREGEVFVLDAGNDRLLQLQSENDLLRWRPVPSARGWLDPTGLASAPNGELWVAEAGAHRVVRVSTEASGEVFFGTYGDQNAQFRQPRDLAWLGDELLVADSGNHRIAVLDEERRLVRSLTSAPVLGQVTRIDVSGEGRIVAVDSQNGWVAVWPGPRKAASDPVGYADAYLRDDRRDVGDPDYAAPVIDSPDLLVRHSPDISISFAERFGLALVGDDVPVYGAPNYLYFEVRNRGTEPFADGALAVWQTNTAEDWPDFPLGAWSGEHFFAVWSETGEQRPGNVIEVPYIPPRHDGADGRAVVGPLVWYPPASNDSNCGDRHSLMLRLIHAGEAIAPRQPIGTDLASNNVALRIVPVVPPNCLPDTDRYEGNDYPASAAPIRAEWTHLHARCPRSITRALRAPYPDTECPGVFENGNAPRGAEEIWQLSVGDLSLHSTTDRDFFRVALPQIENPAWQLNDIRSRDQIAAFRDTPFDTPIPMPECGTVRREDFGPPARDNRVWINITTELVVTAVPKENAVALAPVGSAGEAVRLYDDEGEVLNTPSPEPLVGRVACPASLHDLTEALVSFGERPLEVDGEIIMSPRRLAATGGYELNIAYTSHIDRGIPEWAASANDERGIRRLPCILSVTQASLGVGNAASFGSNFLPGLLPGVTFPNCAGGAELEFPQILVRHPQIPGLVDCIADGPGCFELSRFAWVDALAGRELLFTSPVPLQIQLFDAAGETVAASYAVNAAAVGAAHAIALPTAQLATGDYFMQIEGSPTTLAVSYRAPGDIPPVFPGTQASRRRGSLGVLLAFVALLTVLSSFVRPPVAGRRR